MRVQAKPLGGFLAGIFLLAGCGSNTGQETGSSLQAIKGGAYYDFFVSVLPGQRVSLCGDAVNEVKRAADIWSEVIDRKGRFTYDTNCHGSKVLSIRRVRQGALGAGILGLAGGNSLQFVQGSGFATILHEVGHLWGLGHEPTGGSNVMYPSLLGHQRLTERDRVSIREMASLRNFPANQRWASSGGSRTPATTRASCQIANGLIQHGQTFNATDGYRYTCRNGQLSRSGGLTDNTGSGSGGSSQNICRTSPKINHSLEVIYDPSCLQGGARCIDDLPCRYAN